MGILNAVILCFRYRVYRLIIIGMLDNHLPLESLRGVDIYGFLVKNHFNSLRTIVPV